MTHASSVVLVLLVLASLSAAHPKAGLFGTGYPHDDKWYHPGSNDPETAELCDSLRRHMDVLLRSKIFRCERLNLQDDEAGKENILETLQPRYIYSEQSHQNAAKSLLRFITALLQMVSRSFVTRLG